MIKRNFLFKALEIQRKIETVHLDLITADKICGYVGTGSLCELAVICTNSDYLLTLHPSSKPNSYYFEITLDLPF